MGQDFPRNYPAGARWHVERYPTEPSPDVGRYDEVINGRPLSIDRALRDYAKVPVKSYFLAVLNDDGSTSCYRTPDFIPEGKAQRLMGLWVEAARIHNPNLVSPSAAYQADLGDLDDYGSDRGATYGGRRGHGRRRLRMLNSSDEFPGATKRARVAGGNRQEPDDDSSPAATVSNRRGLMIGDSEEVWKFYDQRFRNCQQNTCKLIAKIWVKAIAPRKQSTNPYSGSTVPEWWPDTHGPNKVRHKEPDHLLKPERLHLLKHILRLVVEPNAKQHPSIQKQMMTVSKLEEHTMDAMSGFFADKDHANNAKRKPFLKELFKIARMEERYKNGEIDGTTTAYIMNNDSARDDDVQSDTEESIEDENKEEEDRDAEHEHEEEHDHGSSAVSATLSPAKSGSSHGILAPPNTGQSPTVHVQDAAPFMGLPTRNHSYHPPLLATGQLGPAQHQDYVEGAAMGVDHFSPPPQDPGRRPSLYGAHPDFGNTATPGPGLYPGWQQTTASPPPHSIYTFASHGAAPTQHAPTFVAQPAGTLPYIPVPGPFDALQRPQDAGYSTMFRTPSVNQEGQPGTPPVYDYGGGADGRTMSSNTVKLEPPNRGPQMP